VNKSLLLATVLLAGCATTLPVTMHFPQIPTPLTTTCDSLVTLDSSKHKLSDLIENATDNYSKYYECNAKVAAWQDWYNAQKKIHEDVK
jgi:hypothetical protein